MRQFFATGEQRRTVRQTPEMPSAGRAIRHAEENVSQVDAHDGRKLLADGCWVSFRLLADARLQAGEFCREEHGHAAAAIVAAENGGATEVVLVCGYWLRRAGDCGLFRRI